MAALSPIIYPRQERQMRLSIVLLLLAAASMLAGAGLVGQWCVGLVVMAWSAGLAAFALLRDSPQRAPSEAELLAGRDAVRMKAWRAS